MPGGPGSISTPPDGSTPGGPDAGLSLPGAQAVLGAIAAGVADQVRATVKPAAVAAVATTFGFPMLLMLAVFIFLITQGRLDERDPKLRNAPLTGADITIAFGNEADLA